MVLRTGPGRGVFGKLQQFVSLLARSNLRGKNVRAGRVVLYAVVFGLTATAHRQLLPPPLSPLPPPPPPRPAFAASTQNMEWNSIGQGDESGVDLFTRTVARRRSGAGASAGAAASDGAAAMELPFDLIPGQLVRTKNQEKKTFYMLSVRSFAALTLLS